jgi:hypothetical protein
VFDANLKLTYHGQFDDARPNNGKAVTGAWQTALFCTMGGVLSLTHMVCRQTLCNKHTTGEERCRAATLHKIYVLLCGVVMVANLPTSS